MGHVERIGVCDMVVKWERRGAGWYG